MNRRLRERVYPYYAAAQMASVSLASYLPSNVARTMTLRAMGARIGEGVVVYHGLQVRHPVGLTVGADSSIGEHVILDSRCSIVIGESVNISSRVAIWTLQHDYSSPTFETVGAAVTIGERAWLSFGSTVLPGVAIGEGAVVAAGAVVTRDVEPFTVVAGIPASVIGHRNRDLRYRIGGPARKLPWW